MYLIVGPRRPPPPPPPPPELLPPPDVAPLMEGNLTEARYAGGDRIALPTKKKAKTAMAPRIPPNRNPRTMPMIMTAACFLVGMVNFGPAKKGVHSTCMLVCGVEKAHTCLSVFTHRENSRPDPVKLIATRPSLQKYSGKQRGVENWALHRNGLFIFSYRFSIELTGDDISTHTADFLILQGIFVQHVRTTCRWQGRRRGWDRIIVIDDLPVHDSRHRDDSLHRRLDNFSKRIFDEWNEVPSGEYQNRNRDVIRSWLPADDMKGYARARRAFAGFCAACLVCFFTSVDKNNGTRILESKEPVGRMNTWEAFASQRSHHAVSKNAQIEVCLCLLFYFYFVIKKLFCVCLNQWFSGRCK